MGLLPKTNDESDHNSPRDTVLKVYSSEANHAETGQWGYRRDHAGGILLPCLMVFF